MPIKISPVFSRCSPPTAHACAAEEAGSGLPVGEADLEQALHALWPVLRGYATSLLGGDRSSVEDTLQETALHVWQHKNDLPEIRNFRSWVFRIVYFKALSCYRDRKASRMIAFEPEVMERIADAAAAALAEGNTDRVDILADCLTHVRSDDRDLLSWHYEHGQPLTQLAEKLGKNADTLHQRVSRLRRSLRRCIESKLNPTLSPAA